MRRLISSTLAVAIFGGIQLAQAQPPGPGPGEGGSVLKDPFAPLPIPAASVPGAPAMTTDGVFGLNAAKGNATAEYWTHKLASLAPSGASKMNDDIKISKTHGPYVIYIQTYVGDDCHKLARQMVSELRTPAYKLNAYTFNKGAEEKQKEYERVKAEYERIVELYRKSGAPADSPIRIGIIKVQEQCAVVLGGYGSEDAARRALEGVHKLKPLDPKKVMLDRLHAGEIREAGPAGKVKEEYINPFLGAFVTTNPEIRQKRPTEWDQLDMSLTRKLNADEPYSLLQCKKPFTLLVKSLKTPTVLQPKSESGSFLANIGLGGKSAQEDAAATSAHNLAGELRNKLKLEAYVLHTRYASFVCVGNYDSYDDPALKSMASVIETKVMPSLAQLFPSAPNQPAMQSNVVPMKIPR